MPSVTASPPSRPSWSLGWIPTPTTTRSAGTSAPSSRITRCTRPSPSIAWTAAPSMKRTPRSSKYRRKNPETGGGKTPGHTRSRASMTIGSRSSFLSVEASSIPTNPAPISTTRCAPPASPRIASASVAVRSVCTPGRVNPGTGSVRARPPVASRSRFPRYVSPASVVAVSVFVSMRSTSTPLMSVTPVWSANHPDGFTYSRSRGVSGACMYSFDRGGRWYGGSSSSVRTATSPSSSISRMPSTAAEAASPPPTMT